MNVNCDVQTMNAPIRFHFLAFFGSAVARRLVQALLAVLPSSAYHFSQGSKPAPVAIALWRRRGSGLAGVSVFAEHRRGLREA